MWNPGGTPGATDRDWSEPDGHGDETNDETRSTPDGQTDGESRSRPETADGPKGCIRFRRSRSKSADRDEWRSVVVSALPRRQAEETLDHRTGR